MTWLIASGQMSGVTFPLTPTLSLGERATLRLSVGLFERMRSSKDAPGCSLSPRERVGVRGNGHPKQGKSLKVLGSGLQPR
jgi:hypothetical protein